MMDDSDTLFRSKYRVICRGIAVHNEVNHYHAIQH